MLALRAAKRVLQKLITATAQQRLGVRRVRVEATGSKSMLDLGWLRGLGVFVIQLCGGRFEPTLRIHQEGSLDDDALAFF